MGLLCKEQCVLTEFVPEFKPRMMEGLWIFRPYMCPNNCNGRGMCETSHCICEPGWGGVDCSRPLCPGSPCYVDPYSQETHCTECSQRGKCVL